MNPTLELQQAAEKTDIFRIVTLLGPRIVTVRCIVYPSANISHTVELNQNLSYVDTKLRLVV